MSLFSQVVGCNSGDMEMNNAVECYWGEAQSQINGFVKEVVDEVATIRKCLSGEETEERQRPERHSTRTAADEDRGADEYLTSTTIRLDQRTTIERSPQRELDFGSTRPAVSPIKERPTNLRFETTAPTTSATKNHATGVTVSEETIDAWKNDDDDELEELSWRMNPLNSMSDWTIHVVVIPATRNQTTNVYHVHKSVLAVGPRRSNYFKNLFREHNQMLQQRAPTITNSTDQATSPTWQFPDIPSATKILGLPPSAAHLRASGPPTHTTATPISQVTRLELPALAASAFPGLLDFLYDSHPSKGPKDQGRFRLTTQNATALHVLAQRLDMKALRSVTRDFWMSDLGLDNLAVYYQHATCLDDPLILRALEMYTAQNLFDTSESRGPGNNTTIADIFDLLDTQFVLNVLTMAWSNHDKAVGTMGMDRHTLSLRLSLIVAVYCHQRHQDGELDYAMFEQLTDTRLLPALEAPAAMALLDLQEELHSEHRNDRLTSLTERCVAVLADNWDDACIMSEQEQTGGRGPSRTVNLPRLAGPALESFASLSLVNAKARLGRLEAEKIEATTSFAQLHQKNDELQRQNDLLQAQLRERRASPTPNSLPQALPPSQSRSIALMNDTTNGAIVCSSDKRTRTSIVDNRSTQAESSIITPPRSEHTRPRSASHTREV